MKFFHNLIGLVLLLASTTFCAAEIQLRVSFKVFLGPNGEWPDNSNTIGTSGVNLNSEQAIRDNIAATNEILRQDDAPFRVFLRDDTVYTISGQDDPWFDIAARDSDNRSDLEDAATANAAAETTFRWHDNSINVYLNDTRSGVCAFPGSGSTILIGAGAYEELLIHEIGHFFNLRHTHPSGSDDNDDANPNDWGDGDGFSETLDDDPDASPAQINTRYSGQSQAVRDDLIFNIMSYHTPQDRFVWQQYEEFVETANDERDSQAIGEGIFLADDGSDTFLGFPRPGDSYESRLETLETAVSKSTSSRDVILIDGTIEVTDGTVFNTPHVWMKWRDNALLR